jgi:molybdopterin/thiamine biosynthesis adenylyltransferase
MNNQILSDPELRRFKDQISLPYIGVEGQERIRNFRIAVVGVGGMGSAVLQLLSSMGVGYLGIIDFRLVEESSMQRQTLFGGNDLGKLKTILSKERLQSIFPFVNYEIINLEITKDNAERIFSGYDLIVDTTNERYISSITFESCQKLSIPALFGSVLATNGYVTFINFKNTGKDILFKDIFADNAVVGSEGKISIAYHFAAVLLCNEIINFITLNSTNVNAKRVSFDLLKYQITTTFPC